jgi:hypothetical protein
MKKIIILSHLITLITLAACSPSQSMSAVYELPSTSELTEAYSSLLPEGYEVPGRLPNTITDSYLLTAWLYLYNQTDAIKIQDGSTITGNDLAMLVITRSIEIRWGSEQICNGNSCSERTICHNQDCIEKYDVNQEYPIFISPRFHDTAEFTLARLAGSIAHELYHHTLPFGPVDTNLYEEYYAFYVGAQIEQADWAIFEGYDPTVSACLKAWFRVNAKQGYLGSDEYPMTLTTPVDTHSQVCGG